MPKTLETKTKLRVTIVDLKVIKVKVSSHGYFPPYTPLAVKMVDTKVRNIHWTGRDTSQSLQTRAVRVIRPWLSLNSD